MPTHYEMIERVPTIAEYRAVCESVGWNQLNFEAAEKSLPCSIYGVVVELEGEVVGMGRIVGDGHMYFYLQDIAIKPEHHKKGLGRKILDHLLSYIREHGSGYVFVALFSTETGKPLYEKFGFEERTDLRGMFQVLTC